MGWGDLVSVYVDDAFIPYGRMLMSHMMADSTEELLAMATKIDLHHRWLQKAGTYKEHFDVSKSYRKDALANGAIAVSTHDLLEKMLAKK